MMDFLENPPYVVAEIGGNHGGNLETAKEYLKAAADVGADMAKFQWYRAETLIDKDEPPLPLAGNEYDTQFERFKELELINEEWDELIELADSVGIDFGASAFDADIADRVAEVSPFIKIASGDLTNYPLLEQVASLNKPIVLSTGFATMEEIERAVNKLPTDRLVLLHCMGSYPTQEEDANLRLIDTLFEEFETQVGYSDHTVGNLASIAAVAKGACIVEKHFTLEPDNPVGDHRLSATPDEMAELVEATTRVRKMLGSGKRDEVFDPENDIRTNMRRSLATSRPIKAGEQLARDDLIGLRPEKGIRADQLDEIVGKKITRDIPKHHILSDGDIQNS